MTEQQYRIIESINGGGLSAADVANDTVDDLFAAVVAAMPAAVAPEGAAVIEDYRGRLYDAAFDGYDDAADAGAAYLCTAADLRDALAAWIDEGRAVRA